MTAECNLVHVVLTLGAVFAGGPPGRWSEGERPKEVQLRPQVPPPTDMRGACTYQTVRFMVHASFCTCRFEHLFNLHLFNVDFNIHNHHPSGWHGLS